jgi:spore maturation protein A
VLNKIWFGLLAIGLLYGFGKAALQDPRAIVPPAPASAPAAPSVETPEPTSEPAPAVSRAAALSEMGKRLTNSAIDSAQTSVEICIALIGMMALWLGVMKVAEDAGLVALLARLLRPVLRWLFPDIPRDHPAGGAIIMNFAANVLGLDNAATPLGLKAMKELQSLNPIKDTSTNSMAMFLAINTSSISLVAFTVIAYRKAAGSTDPASVITATILATTCSTAVAIIAARLLQRFYPLRSAPIASTSADSPASPQALSDGTTDAARTEDE